MGRGVIGDRDAVSGGVNAGGFLIDRGGGWRVASGSSVGLSLGLQVSPSTTKSKAAFLKANRSALSEEDVVEHGDPLAGVAVAGEDLFREQPDVESSAASSGEKRIALPSPATR